MRDSPQSVPVAVLAYSDSQGHANFICPDERHDSGHERKFCHNGDQQAPVGDDAPESLPTKLDRVLKL